MIGYKKILLLVLALVLASFAYFFTPATLYPKAPAVAFMIVLMAFFWVTEILPLAVTSLIPIVFLPVIGIATLSEVTSY